jgi:hypothetical protein
MEESKRKGTDEKTNFFQVFITIIYMEVILMTQSGFQRPNEHIVFFNMFSSCEGVIKERLKMKIEELSIEDTSYMHKRLL